LRIVVEPARSVSAKPWDGGKRRAQLVGNVGDEIAAHALEFDAVRFDVVQHETRRRFAARTAATVTAKNLLVEALPVTISVSTPPPRAPLSIHLETASIQTRLADNLNERHCGSRRQVQTKNFREALVGKSRRSESINTGYAFHHTRENCGGKIALFGQRRIVTIKRAAVWFSETARESSDRRAVRCNGEITFALRRENFVRPSTRSEKDREKSNEAVS